jgi:RNA polymerase sigma-70 factor (ECF subfamily)
MQLSVLYRALTAYTGTIYMDKSETTRHAEFMQLYNQSHARLTRYVQSVVYSRADVKDIVSETVLKVYEKFDTIEKKESFIYYLFKTASRLITDLHKKQNRFAELDEELFLQLPASTITTAQSLEVKDLYTALSQLPLATREALVLYEIDGFSQEEICKIQGGTLSGVKSRITRGREALKKIIVAADAVKTF